MKTKESCLKRWKAAKNKRAAVAQQILSGKKRMNKAWPMWVQYDIRAEMALIKRERAKARDDARQRKQAHEQAKRALESTLL